MSLAEKAEVAVQSAAGSGAEELTLHFLYQLIVILAVTKCMVWVGRKYLRQTTVVGEILAGIVLGPSLLGALFPAAFASLFHPSTSTIFVGFAQVGLVLLMFQIGLEFEFSAKLAQKRRSVVVISLLGIVVPFALGYLTAPFFWSRMPEPRPAELGFRLFFAIAMSITSIPVLGRIFMELGLSHTKTAALTIGAAAIDDIVGWVLLGVVAAVVASNFDSLELTYRIAGLFLYLAIVWTVVRPALRFAIRKEFERRTTLRTSAVSAALIVMFASAAVTSNLGVFAIIGGFAVGISLHEERAFVRVWKERVGPLVFSLLMPMFFAYTGLRTDVGSLSDGAAWVDCALVCGVAFAGKFGGAAIAATLVGETPRSALTIGVCMNTRALMELVALNIGYDMGVLPRRMFTMLVLMALVSTFMATPLIAWLMSAERTPEPAEDTEPVASDLTAMSPSAG